MEMDTQSQMSPDTVKDFFKEEFHEDKAKKYETALENFLSNFSSTLKEIHETAKVDLNEKKKSIDGEIARLEEQKEKIKKNFKEIFHGNSIDYQDQLLQPKVKEYHKIMKDISTQDDIVRNLEFLSAINFDVPEEIPALERMRFFIHRAHQIISIYHPECRIYCNGDDLVLFCHDDELKKNLPRKNKKNSFMKNAALNRIYYTLAHLFVTGGLELGNIAEMYEKNSEFLDSLEKAPEERRDQSVENYGKILRQPSITKRNSLHLANENYFSKLIEQQKKLKADDWKFAKEGKPKDYNETTFEIYKTGVFGETPLHISCLFSNEGLFQALIERNNHLANETYKYDYEGETILHMATANGNLLMVSKIFQDCCKHQIKRLCETRCTGQFFRAPPEGVYYVGEYPITFVATISNFERAKDILLQYLEYDITLLNKGDSYGNNLLHILVLHSHYELTEWLIEYVRKPEKSSQDRVEDKEKEKERKNEKEKKEKCRRLFEEAFNHENNLGKKPITLACFLGNSKMVSVLLNYHKEFFWTYGTISAYSFNNLDLADSWNVKNELIIRMNSVLEMTVYMSLEGTSDSETSLDRADILKIPLISQLIHKKWVKYAQPLFRIWLLLYLLFVAIFCVSVVRPKVIYSGNSPLSFDNQGTLEWIIDIFILGFATVSLSFEFVDLVRLNTKYILDRGSILFYLFSWLYSISIWFSYILRWNGDENYDIFLSFACVFVWLYLIYFARGFPQLALFVSSIRQIIQRDIFRFLVVYFIFLSGFALAFSVQYRRTAEIEFLQYDRSLYSIFTNSFFSFTVIPDESRNPWLVYTLYVIFIFFVPLLLLNMLIAMMNDTYSRLNSDAEKMRSLEWASMILLIERRIELVPIVKRLIRVDSELAEEKENNSSQNDDQKSKKRRFLVQESLVDSQKQNERSHKYQTK